MKALLITLAFACISFISAQEAEKSALENAEPALDNAILELLKLSKTIADEAEQDDHKAMAEVLGAIANSLSTQADSLKTGEPTLDSTLIDFFAASSKILEGVITEKPVARNPNDPTLDSTIIDLMDVGGRLMGEMMSQMPEVLETIEREMNTQVPASQDQIDQLLKENKALTRQIELQKQLEKLKQENKALKQQLNEADSLQVSVHSDGTVTLDGEKISTEQLKKKIKSSPHSKLNIESDKAVLSSKIDELLQASHEAGISNVTFSIKE